MAQNKKLIAIVAVIIIIAAAVGIYWYATKDNGDDPNKVTFLIEDNDGVYFWVSGSGEMTDDAFENAVSKSAVDLQSSESSYGISINGINGLENESDWSYYWATYTYSDGEWKYADDGLSVMKSSDYDYIALFYVANNYPSDPILPDNIPSVQDAKIWTKDTSGVLFTIESQSGMYLRINGTGTTVYDALDDATSNYNIEFTGSEWTSYGKVIDTIFDLGMVSVDDVYTFWSTKVLSDDGTAWETSEHVVGGLLSSENAQICLIYSTGSETPIAPVYSA